MYSHLTRRLVHPVGRGGSLLIFSLGFLSLLLVALTPAIAAQLRLDWEDNSGNENGFKIWRAEPGGTYAQIAVRPSNATSYVDTTVTAGVDYCYQVLAYNDSGESAPSNEACQTASDTTGYAASSVAATSSATAVDSPTAASTPVSAGGGGGGGCFIATAAFGSPLAPQVQLLREVRDKYLLPYRPGQAAVRGYYAVSPPIADVISRSEMLRGAVRFALMPLLGWATLALWSPALGFGVPLLPIVGVWLVVRRSRRD
jgi:hypothetical protein